MARRRRNKCKCCGKEFTTTYPHKRFCSDICRYLFAYQKRCVGDSLCWECTNATGFCSWSADFTPVDGWEAEETIIKQKGNPIPSFKVQKCPLYKKG